MEAFFVSPTYIKENTAILSNIEDKEMYPYIRSAQDVYMQEALGTALYNRLKEGVTDYMSSPVGPNTLDADELVLLNYARNAVMWYTAYDMLPFIWMKLRNVGLVKQGGENMQSASTSEMSYIQDKLKIKGDFYFNRMQAYLCENSSLFTEYNTGCWGCGDLAANGNPITQSDIYFDKNDRIDPHEDYRRFLNL